MIDLEKLVERSPVAYAYARVSHEKQISEGDSLPAQCHTTQNYYNAFLKGKGVAWGDVIPDEKAQSAYKKPFSRRPAGKRLMKLLQPGDHLIIDKVDRIWRNLKDFTSLMEWFTTNKIQVHFVNFSGAQFTFGTPMGNFMLGVFVLISELSSATTGERNKAVVKYKRSQGFYVGGKDAPVGTRKIGKKGAWRLEWDPRQRQLMQEIVRLRDDEGWTWEAISQHFERKRCKQEGIVFKKSAFFKRVLTWQRCSRAYKREKQYTAMGNPDPSMIEYQALDKEVRVKMR